MRISLLRLLRRRTLLLLVLLALLSPSASSLAAPARQDAPPPDYAGKARALLDTLTPEERVGQLFLVNFTGPEAGPGTPIYDLIVNRHVGGVMLLAANDNFLAPDQTAAGALNLIRQLQLDEYNSSLTTQTDPITDTTFQPAYIPLLMSTIQEGDSYPYDQLFNGLTPLPNPMTLGATWKPEMAQQVGSMLGQELSILGFNLLFGPSLDVLDTPRAESAGDLGTRAFGGDPFWVGEMGRAYIGGVHQGSAGRLAVVAKHFPGFGGSDRLPEDEVATVRKSLEQLKQIELAPFFAVTGSAADAQTTADALLTSHIRYQGFQGNIRATTKPVSFDPEAFAQLMALPQFNTWRSAGGVMISADLGSRAVRRFYDPSGQTFDSRFVARDAFLAGNDLLYLGNFTASGDEGSYTSTIRTLDFFTQKYREDDAFAQRVDEAALRVLILKYRLYNNRLNINDVLPRPDNLIHLSQAGQAILDIASQAATLISPGQAELNDSLPEGPQREDKIVFLTDARTFQQCSRCPLQYRLSPTSLEQAVLRLYSRAGQVVANNLKSYSFEDLQAMLDAGSGTTEIESKLKGADWIVVSMLNITPNVPTSQALRRFLDERADLLQQKRLIVFAFTAPYYLDATDISKLTAYYALYSRGPQFVDVAARLLFHELRAPGILPVSVPGVGYLLNDKIAPDPAQVIGVSFDFPESEPPAETPTPAATPLPPTFQIGDGLPVRTGIILDRNGHTVPDNTPVRFKFTRLGDTPVQQTVDSMTYQGVAKAIFRIDAAGKWEIRAESGDALQSDALPFEVRSPEEPQPPTPTLSPSPTLTPSSSPTLTPSNTSTEVTPTAALSTPTATPTPEPEPMKANFGDWLMAVVIAAGVGIAIYMLIASSGQMRWGVRGGLMALSGGLIAYTYLALGLPGSSVLLQNLWGVIVVALIGAGLGGGSIWLWRQLYRLKGNR